MTRLTDEALAPKHNPVDMPPHPEKRSSNANSVFWNSEWGRVSVIVETSVKRFSRAAGGDNSLVLTGLYKVRHLLDIILNKLIKKKTEHVFEDHCWTSSAQLTL